MSKLRGLWVGAVAGAAVVLTAGCKENRDTGAVTTRTEGGTSNAPAAAAVEERDHALVRVVNAIPGGGITIWAGDSATFTDVGFKKTTGYREIPDDRFNFKLRSGKTAESEPLAENRENLNGGGHYTIVALPDEGGADKRNLRVLDDDLKPVGADQARVRFINGVPGDFDVDVFLQGREDPIFDGVNFKMEAGWTEIDPIAGTLAVRPDNEKKTLASLADVKLEGGKSYTFVFTGKPGKYEIVEIEDEVASK